jgi:hypothetical protein
MVKNRQEVWRASAETEKEIRIGVNCQMVWCAPSIMLSGVTRNI